MAEELKIKVRNNLPALGEGKVLRSKRHSYRIIGEIARGGFGITYKVENLQDFLVGDRRDSTGKVVDSGVVVKAGTTLVLKECCHEGSMVRLPNGKLRLTDVEKGANIRRQFYDEAVALTHLLYQVPSSRFARLMSGFVPIYHAGTLASINRKPDYEADNIVYLVMPMLDGGSFADVLRNGTPVTAQHYAYWLFLLLNGLQHVHDNHKVHRDIKPSNIMLTGSQQAVLIDFGAIAETHKGAVVNQRTPDYASPEQMDDLLSGGLDGRSDLYSLALTFYVMLTKTNPQSKRNPSPWRKLSEDARLVDLFDKVLFQVEGSKRPLKGFGKRFLMALERGLIPDRNTRWASARDWRNAVYNGLLPCAPAVEHLSPEGGEYSFTSSSCVPGAKSVGVSGKSAPAAVNRATVAGAKSGVSRPSSASKKSKAQQPQSDSLTLWIVIVSVVLIVLLVFAVVSF